MIELENFNPINLDEINELTNYNLVNQDIQNGSVPIDNLDDIFLTASPNLTNNENMNIWNINDTNIYLDIHIDNYTIDYIYDPLLTDVNEHTENLMNYENMEEWNTDETNVSTQTMEQELFEWNVNDYFNN